MYVCIIPKTQNIYSYFDLELDTLATVQKKTEIRG